MEVEWGGSRGVVVIVGVGGEREGRRLGKDHGAGIMISDRGEGKPRGEKGIG